MWFIAFEIQTWIVAGLVLGLSTFSWLELSFKKGQVLCRLAVSTLIFILAHPAKALCAKNLLLLHWVNWKVYILEYLRHETCASFLCIRLFTLCIETKLAAKLLKVSQGKNKSDQPKRCTLDYKNVCRFVWNTREESIQKKLLRDTFKKRNQQEVNPILGYTWGNLLTSSWDSSRCLKVF